MILNLLLVVKVTLRCEQNIRNGQIIVFKVKIVL